MNTRKRCGSFLVALGLVAANLIVFNWLSLSNFARADLTRDKLFTLHPATVDLLHGLDDLVTLTVYLSEKRFAENQGYSQIPRSVRDMVEEFVAQGNGNVKATFIDPTGDEELERQAQSAGIQPVPVQGMERDQVKRFNAFIGILISYGGKEDEKLPLAYFHNEEYRLELELGLAIARLCRRETITIGVNAVTELPEGINPQMAAQMGMVPDKFDIDQNYRYLKDELAKFYQVEKVSVKSAIPEHITLLVLANTDGLDDVAKYHIDQYLMKGGKMMVLTSGVDVDPRAGMPVPRPNDNDEFFRHYGFSVAQNMILDRQGMPDGRNPFSEPLYFSPVILPRNFNAESSLMAGVGAFTLLLASSLQLNPPAGVEATVLATTTGLAWQQTGVFSIDPSTPQANPPENEDEYKTFDVVGMLEGEFESYFSNRPLPEGVGSDAKPPSAADFENAGGEDHSGHDHADGEHTPPAQGGGNGGDAPQEGAANPPAPAAQEPTPTPAPVDPPTPPGQEATGATAAPTAGAASTFVKAKSPRTKILIVSSNYFLVPMPFSSRDLFDANLRFVSTMIERLTTGSKLSDLRNRTIQRPSIKGDLSVGTQSTIKWFGILGMPAIVAAFGIAMWLLRKNRRPMRGAA